MQKKTQNDKRELTAIRETLGLPEPSLQQSAKKSEDDEVKEVFRKSIEAIRRDFVVGQSYTITETNQEKDNHTWYTPILCYEGKRGIHHMFREVNGKWLVTYTDAQLIGKHVKEAERKTMT